MPPLLYESHAHTTLCKHAHGTPSEYAAQAEARGLKGIIFTCHCPLPDGLSLQYRMSPEEFPAYVDLVARTREEFAGRVIKGRLDKGSSVMDPRSGGCFCHAKGTVKDERHLRTDTVG